MAFGFLDSYMNMFGGKNSLMGMQPQQQGFGMAQPNWAQPNGFGGQGFQFGGNIGNQQMQGQPPMFNGQGPQQGIAPLQGQQSVGNPNQAPFNGPLINPDQKINPKGGYNPYNPPSQRLPFGAENWSTWSQPKVRISPIEQQVGFVGG